MVLRCKLRFNKIQKVIALGLIVFIISNICLGIFKILFNTLTFNWKKCILEEPIDVVYTWVNGSDPFFIHNLNQHLNVNDHSHDFSKKRYDDKYELKFSLRSLEKYAPWVNHVYIVTNGQIPYWLNLDYEKVSLVTHEDIFRNVYNLPTFSSPAIECNLHRISGLSKKFIYFNDDIFLGAPVYLEDFYVSNKGYLIYLAWSLPNCAPKCPWLYVSDGQCDKECYTSECQMDGNDCADFNKKIYDFGGDKYIKLNNKSSVNNTTKTNLFDIFIKKLVPIHRSNQVSLANESFFLNTIRMVHYSNLTNLVSEHNRRIMKQDKISKKYMYKRKYDQSHNKYKRNTMNLDTYSASLQFTNRLFNRRFQFVNRKVPSHAPILIDKDIMEELYLTFNKEFYETERHKFRSKNDVQFAFSYYSFIMSKKTKKSVDEIFDDYDTDKSSTWSDRELRTLLSKLYDLPLSYATIDHFEGIIHNCSKGKNVNEVPTPPYERYIDSGLPTISKNLVTSCSVLKNVLLEKFGHSCKYAFEVISNAEEKFVAFKMLNSNISDVVNSLDDVRSNEKKFVCLNDNLDETKDNENELVKAILYDFYLSLFPLPSKFELPEDYRNRFYYVKDLRVWKSYHNKIKLFLYCLISVVLYLSVCGLFKKKCCQLLNKLFS